jgi:hypothetical protein
MGIPLGTRRSETVTTCQLCEAEIPEGHQVEVQGKGRRGLNSIICPNCASGIEQGLQAETENPNLVLAVLAGLAAAAAGTLVWYGVVVITNYQLGFIAVGVGWLVAMAVVFGSGRKRGDALQAISVAITLVALVMSEYLIVRYALTEFLIEQGFTEIPLFLPLGAMLELVVKSIQENLFTLIFWAIALWAAWSTPARRHLRRVDQA